VPALPPKRLVQGRIIRAYGNDPQGGNPKVRPWVIVTPTDEIEPGIAFQVVGITTQMHLYPSEHYVQVPHANPPARCVTELKEESAALCYWVVSLSENEIVRREGIVPPKYLNQILEKLSALGKAKESEAERSSPDESSPGPE
jgi:hypothetical protein